MEKKLFLWAMEGDTEEVIFDDIQEMLLDCYYQCNRVLVNTLESIDKDFVETLDHEFDSSQQTLERTYQVFEVEIKLTPKQKIKKSGDYCVDTQVEYFE